MRREDIPRPESPPSGGHQPFIHPSVPQKGLTQAELYKQGMMARRAQKGPPKGNMPLAGGDPPMIPRLDQPPTQEGLTMSQHAQMSRAPVQQPLSRPMEGGSFVEPPPPMTPTGQPRLDLRPMDVLPQEARKDPEFQTGYGDMFAANQQHLALKYGVIRNGHIISPQQLANPYGEKKHLRPETVRDLEQLKALQNAQSAPNVKTTEEEAAGEASDAAKAAATVGNLPGDTSEKPLSEKERKELSSAMSNMDEFQFDAWRQAMMKDLLNNPGQRKIIEERLKPMDVADLITDGYVVQKVPIIPGKFEPSFITTDGQTDLSLKRLIMEDSKSLEVSDRYYLDKFALMSVAASLYAINTTRFPSHLDNEGNFDDELFRKKFNMVLRQPLHLLASLGINAFWFDERVRKLFVAEKLGNG